VIGEKTRSGAKVKKRAVEDHAEAGEKEKRRQDLVDKGRNGNGKSHAAVSGGEKINDAGEKRIEETAPHVFAALEGLDGVDSGFDGVHGTRGGNSFAAIGAAR